MGVDAQIRVLQAQKRAHHQTGAHEQNHGERNFGDDQDGTQLSVRCGWIVRRAGSAQMRSQIKPHGVNRWCHAAYQGTQHGHAEREWKGDAPARFLVWVVGRPDDPKMVGAVAHVLRMHLQLELSDSDLLLAEKRVLQRLNATVDVSSFVKPCQ